MFDELDRLRTEEPLRQLLAHYVEAGEPDRVAWQDRLMQVDGVEPEVLTKLHGELLAYGWVDLNVGASPGLRNGAVPLCYRATAAGRRALKRAGTEPEMDGDVQAEAA
jgi:hypothetical protein